MEKEKRIFCKKAKRAIYELAPDEKIVVNILQAQEQIHIDELYIKSKLSSSAVASALLMLEMQNVVSSFPGKIY